MGVLAETMELPQCPSDLHFLAAYLEGAHCEVHPNGILLWLSVDSRFEMLYHTCLPHIGISNEDDLEQIIHILICCSGWAGELHDSGFLEQTQGGKTTVSSCTKDSVEDKLRPLVVAFTGQTFSWVKDVNDCSGVGSCPTSPYPRYMWCQLWEGPHTDKAILWWEKSVLSFTKLETRGNPSSEDEIPKEQDSGENAYRSSALAISQVEEISAATRSLAAHQLMTTDKISLGSQFKEDSQVCEHTWVQCPKRPEVLGTLKLEW